MSRMHRATISLAERIPLRPPLCATENKDPTSDRNMENVVLRKVAENPQLGGDIGRVVHSAISCDDNPKPA